MKKFIAVIAGLLVAFVIISIGTYAILKSYGVIGPSFFELNSIKGMVASLSTVGLILMIVAHAIGALAGGVTVGFILKDDTMNVGLTLGVVLTILGLVNMIMITTYPEWFYLDFAVFIPCSMIGASYTSKL